MTTPPPPRNRPPVTDPVKLRPGHVWPHARAAAPAVAGPAAERDGVSLNWLYTQLDQAHLCVSRAIEHGNGVALTRFRNVAAELERDIARGLGRQTAGRAQ